MFFLLILAIWTLICAVPIVPILFVPEFYTVSISFIIFLSVGILNSMLVANSIVEFTANIRYCIVQLTKRHVWTILLHSIRLMVNENRATAICVIMVCGRIGAFTGSNVIGIFMTDYCTTIFGVAGAMILSWVNCWNNEILRTN